jgi:hypothetical protein
MADKAATEKTGTEAEHNNPEDQPIDGRPPDVLARAREVPMLPCVRDRGSPYPAEG